jgi:RNase P subunit RPR2
MKCPNCEHIGVYPEEESERLIEEVDGCSHLEVTCECPACGTEFWWDWWDC